MFLVPHSSTDPQSPITPSLHQDPHSPLPTALANLHLLLLCPDGRLLESLLRSLGSLDLFPLALALLILGGLRSGLFTPTEAYTWSTSIFGSSS